MNVEKLKETITKLRLIDRCIHVEEQQNSVDGNIHEIRTVV